MKFTKLCIVVLLISSLIMFAGCGTQEKPSDNQSTEANKEVEQNNEDKSTVAEEYPTKDITILCPYGPGGTDNFTRAISLSLTDIMGQTVVVNNVSGAAGSVGMTQFCKTPADGYTILTISTDLIINSAMKRSEYTHKDLIPIGRIQHDQSMFWVNPDGPYKTMEDVIKYAKENPGKLNFGITSPAGFDEVLVSSFCDAAGIEANIIPFNSGSETMAALLGKHVDLMHEEPSSAMSVYESGKIKPVVVMTEERLPKFSDVPTAKELGYDVTLAIWRGAFVNKGTPVHIVKYLEDAFKKAFDDPQYKDIEEKSMLDQRPGYLNSEDFGKFLEEEFEIYSGALKKLGYI